MIINMYMYSLLLYWLRGHMKSYFSRRGKQYVCIGSNLYQKRPGSSAVPPPEHPLNGMLLICACRASTRFHAGVCRCIQAWCNYRGVV